MTTVLKSHSILQIEKGNKIQFSNRVTKLNRLKEDRIIAAVSLRLNGRGKHKVYRKNCSD